MNAVEVVKALNKTPYFTALNVNPDCYGMLSRLREAILKRDPNELHLLNKENVTGLWAILPYEDDDNPHIVLRTNIPLHTHERMRLVAEIFDYFPHDIPYDYEAHIVNTQDEYLCMDILSGRARTVYDKEREKA